MPEQRKLLFARRLCSPASVSLARSTCFTLFTSPLENLSIASSLDHPLQLVIVHLIHSRENFYEKLKRIFH
jgi:hypothetical protein